MRIFKLAAAAMLGVRAIGLAGCATGFPAKVSRYQAMPAPAGPELLSSCRSTAPMSAGSNSPAMPAWSAQAMQRARLCGSRLRPRRRRCSSASAMASMMGTTEIVSRPFRDGSASTAASTGGLITRGSAMAGALGTRALPSITAGTIRSGMAAAVDRQLHGLRELPRPRHPPPRRQCLAVRRPCQGALADRRSRA